MPTAQVHVEDLLAAVKQLSPAELREFARQFAEWQEQNGEQTEAGLIRATRAHLPAADERRLKQLIAKSERSTLTPTELAEYRSLAEQAERIDVARVEALAELVVRGAGNNPSELAWACPACNGHKYAKTHARDPQTGRVVALFHPRRQRWSRHFTWSEDFLRIIGRTATGRATVAELHLKRPALLNLRCALRVIGAHPPDAE